MGIYPEKTIIQKDTGTPLFTAALYTISRMLISHDGGQDPKIIGKFNQIQELSDFDLVDIFADYTDKFI